ncbi:hypothetical protein [Tardiphaga sp.]|jgi:hypothetical protein|uniref:hypothetical protein n=1 Tax=Tardiphaga sp. TaxID=1926292 RepID=UPI0037DA41EA
MSTFDIKLASRLDDLAHQAASGIAEVMIVAASRLRQLADLPDHVLPPPPIVPIKLDPAPIGEDDHVLETVDGVSSGMHDMGAMPERNARLKKPAGSDLVIEPRTIFTDPRLLPGYKPPKR